MEFCSIKKNKKSRILYYEKERCGDDERTVDRCESRAWCNAMCISLQYTYEEVKHSFEFLYQTKTLLRRSFTIFLFLALLHRLQAKKEIFLDIIESFWITLYDPKNVYIVWCFFYVFVFWNGICFSSKNGKNSMFDISSVCNFDITSF